MSKFRFLRGWSKIFGWLNYVIKDYRRSSSKKPDIRISTQWCRSRISGLQGVQFSQTRNIVTTMTEDRDIWKTPKKKKKRKEQSSPQIMRSSVVYFSNFIESSSMDYLGWTSINLFYHIIRITLPLKYQWWHHAHQSDVKKKQKNLQRTFNGWNFAYTSSSAPYSSFRFLLVEGVQSQFLGVTSLLFQGHFSSQKSQPSYKTNQK